ncbi:MAG TPA: ABC transporter substrate-binding protein [Ktedonobacteraceae bacterium]
MRYITRHPGKDLSTRVRWSIFPVFALLLTFLFAACGSGGSANTTNSKFGGKLNVGLNADAVTLDPLLSTALVDRQVMLNLYDTLVRVDAQNTIQPDLATSWSYATPTQLVFTLRTDVKFTDGSSLDANAVVFNINRILNTPASPRFSEISTIKSVVAADASHVQFNLKKAFAPLLATLTDRSGMILSPTAVQNLGKGLANGPVNAGSGPFQFKEWVKGDHLTIVRNPHYWQKDAQGNVLPYLQSVTYHGITNGTVEFTNLQTGTIDVADSVDPNFVSQAKANSNLVYHQIPGLSFFGIELNVSVAPLNNVHVRRAIEWGVNRDEIVNTVFKGVAVVAQGPLSPGSWAFDSSFAPYHYDVNQAKTELQMGGAAQGITFTMLISSGSPILTQEAQFIQSELQPVGIKVNIQQETFATLLSDTQAHHFQAALLGWSGRPDPDGNTFSWFHTGGGNNNMLYSSAQVDTLLETARASNDQATRARDYIQAQQIIAQDSSYVFIYHGVSIQASSTRVQNFLILPTTIMEFANVYLS